MNAVLARLDPQTKEALRRQFMGGEDQEWVVKLAAEHGWREANRRYLESTRERGAQEMTALMEAAGVRSVASGDEALELLEAAFALYAPEATIERTTTPSGEAVLRVRVVNCPIYAHIEASRWHGITACCAWHRRQGWYDALGISVRDNVVAEKKWGDLACAAVIEIAQVPMAAA